MKLLTLAMLGLALCLPARADTDLCTYGPDRDVHEWLSHPKGLGDVFCGKKAKSETARTATEIRKRLLKDGYHIASGPNVEALPIGKDPNIFLSAALANAHCKGPAPRVSIVCVSLKESNPFARIQPSNLPEPPPEHRDGRKEGQTRIF